MILQLEHKKLINYLEEKVAKGISKYTYISSIFRNVNQMIINTVDVRNLKPNSKEPKNEKEKQ